MKVVEEEDTCNLSMRVELECIVLVVFDIQFFLDPCENFVKNIIIDPKLKFQNGSNINMSDAVYLHQQHVNQCKAILKFCGAKELQVKEERSLKTALDDDFQKYSRH